MSDEKREEDLSGWLSTYGMVTAQRILERYKIYLDEEDFIRVLKNPSIFYHRLLHVPLRNVLNGIVLQQAYDYQVYAQKLFIDYLLSGETTKKEVVSGNFVQEDLEKERQYLIQLAEAFREQEIGHSQLIASSQKSLIKLISHWHKLILKLAKIAKKELKKEGVHLEVSLIVNLINTLLLTPNSSYQEEENIWKKATQFIKQAPSPEIKQIFISKMKRLEEFVQENEALFTLHLEKAKQLTIVLCDFRKKFYNLIVKINELIVLLPGYQQDLAQIEENKEVLYFDAAIGES